MLSSGTLADKTAALTLLVQGSPLHNLQGIDTLVGMVKKKCRREALAALGRLLIFFSELLWASWMSDQLFIVSSWLLLLRFLIFTLSAVD